uniref:RNA-dependent RNA polymerase n=1 Tax=Heligmosomoides polygyrus TaxID=6339 RepID=A0A183GUU2_HELPZ
LPATHGDLHGVLRAVMRFLTSSTYAVPRSKADNIYHFLLQWSPEKYGQV